MLGIVERKSSIRIGWTLQGPLGTPRDPQGAPRDPQGLPNDVQGASGGPRGAPGSENRGSRCVFCMMLYWKMMKCLKRTVFSVYFQMVGHSLEQVANSQLGWSGFVRDS